MCAESQPSFRRLVALLEILRVAAHLYVQSAVNMDTAMTALSQRDIWQDTEHQAALNSAMQHLGTLCDVCELPVSRFFVIKILAALDDPSRIANNDLFQQYIHQLRESLVAELQTKLFFQMPSSKAPFFDSPRLGWAEVIARFSDTVGDIEEMSKCFSMARYGGCVFHSLLIVERGLIELGHAIGVNDPKPGWDATCKGMKKLVDDGHAKYPSWKISFTSLEQISVCASSMKHAWRNKVNHAAGHLMVVQSDFAPDVAEEIMMATRAFMRRLASDLPK